MPLRPQVFSGTLSPRELVVGERTGDELERGRLVVHERLDHLALLFERGLLFLAPRLQPRRPCLDVGAQPRVLLPRLLDPLLDTLEVVVEFALQRPDVGLKIANVAEQVLGFAGELELRHRASAPRSSAWSR